MKESFYKIYRFSQCFFLCLSFSIHAFADDSTHVNIYQPFTLTPTETIQGQCTRHSERDNRSDAWQCKAGTRTLDPCFIKTQINTHIAICPVSPWQTQAVAVTWGIDTQYAPEEKLDVSNDDPWAIDLSNGVHCMQLSHPFVSADGQSIRYGCDNHGFLLGHIQRCELIWKILFQPSRTSTEMNTVEIANVWF